MISLSKNEFSVLCFLIRNFSKRLTIRNIAARLTISAASAHSVLKKLESHNIVKAEKLGTGLFYEINLDNRIAQHLAGIVLLEYRKLKKIETAELEKESRAAIFDGKKLFVVASNIDSVNDICYSTFKDIKIICKSEDDFVKLLKEKEKEVLEILEQGEVLFGEDLIVNTIKKVMR